MSDTYVAAVTGITPTGGLSAAGVGLVPVTNLVRVVLGNAVGGLHYQADFADLLLIAKGQAGYDYLAGTYLDPSLAGALLSMQPGEVALLHKSGSSLRLNADGSITLTPAAGKTVNVGAAGAAAALVGSTVQVNVSTGAGTVTGGGSSTLKA